MPLKMLEMLVLFNVCFFRPCGADGATHELDVRYAQSLREIQEKYNFDLKKSIWIGGFNRILVR